MIYVEIFQLFVKLRRRKDSIFFIDYNDLLEKIL